MATWTFRSLGDGGDRDDAKRFLSEGDHPIWRTIAKQIGAVLVATSQKAFREQRLGSIEWPQRYPNQKGAPFVNIAGVVSDLGQGRNPPKRRFEPRPALRDTGELLGSLSASHAITLEPFSVSLSSDRAHAQVHQEGGKSTLLVDTKVRYGLMKLLRKRKDLSARLGWLFQTNYEDTLETTIHRRPFLGVTDEARRKILRIVDQNLEGRPWDQEEPLES